MLLRTSVAHPVVLGHPNSSTATPYAPGRDTKLSLDVSTMRPLEVDDNDSFK